MSPEILIFVVEDEENIRVLLEHILEDAGFMVRVASSGEDALARLDDDGADFRAVVTDINLGGEVTGWDVARRARELQAELPIVYMSGGASHEWTSLGVPGSVLVVKPFVPMQIVTALSTLLNNAIGAGSSAPG